MNQQNPTHHPINSAIQPNQPAKRIVCLTATGIDILAELNLEPIGYLAKGIANRIEFYGDRAANFAKVGSWMVPNIQLIRKLKPDLIIGWTFPHRFYLPWLQRICPVYLLGGCGYEMAAKHLRHIGDFTGCSEAAEIAILRLNKQIEIYQKTIINNQKKTVLMMGGSLLSLLSGRYIVETNAGTIGSVIQKMTNYPWREPAINKGEIGFINLSIEQILQVNPDVIFIQTYGLNQTSISQRLDRHRHWRQLKAFKQQQIYDVEQFWHWGNGTRTIGLTLDRLMLKIYPELF
jgi:iron complex transport system substrate-binding protein